MSDAPKFDLRGTNIGNLADTVHGNQIATQHIDAQQVDASEQTFELLLTDFQQFINDLQQKYPDATDEKAIQTIDVEVKELQRTKPLRWQNFVNLKRLWNGGKKAAFKVGEHYAEQNPFGKGAIAFLEGVMEEPK